MIKLGDTFVCVEMLRDGAQTLCTDGTEGNPIVNVGEIGTVSRVDNPKIYGRYQYSLDFLRIKKTCRVPVSQKYIDRFFRPERQPILRLVK